MKKYLLTFFCVWSIFSNTFAAPAESNEEALFISPSLKVIPKNHHEENSSLHYIIDVNYPQIEGKNLSAAAKQFNQVIHTIVNKPIQQFINYVKADAVHMQTLPESIQHNSLNIDYDIDVIKPGKQNLISIRFSIEGMQAGRAHPYHKHEIFNYNLTRGKEITLKDLFKSHANFLAVFASYSKKKLNETLKDKFMIAEGTKPDLKNYSIWNLENDGILITFNEYQVAPYAEGAQETHIPFNVLKKLLAPNAPVQPCVENSTSCAAL